jgi:hypothetical protein
MNTIQRINSNTQNHEIERINLYLESLYPKDQEEVIKKIKKYYKKYIDKRQIKNNSILKSIYNIKADYNSNKNINKSLTNTPRNNEKFMQEIYIQEVREIISYLFHNLDNQEIFPNFESIILYTAKKRKFIELYKLNLAILVDNNTKTQMFYYFGRFRGITFNQWNEKHLDFISPVIDSKGQHLVDYIYQNFKIYPYPSNEKYPIKYKDFYLTHIDFPDSKINYLRWVHTLDTQIYDLLQEMNKLFQKFKSSLSNSNKEKPKNLLSELYWLYMQTCPFFRGSASIGEIIFSALLQKYFNCDFKLLREKFNPVIIPDIHALTYTLDLFKSIFWQQFVTCENNKNNSNGK